MVADNIDGTTDRLRSSSRAPHAKPPLSPSHASPSFRNATNKTPNSLNSGQDSRRRSPRLLENNNAAEIDDVKVNSGSSSKPPAKKKLRTTSASECVSFLIGDPVPDEDARRRWPWRYESTGQGNKGHGSKTNHDGDDDDKLVLNVRCHYLQAEIEKCVFDLGDCAYVKGEVGGQNYVGRILEFFKSTENEDFFRVQWFFRAEDTVIKDEAASHDKKRLFYSTIMNDNALDCIVSKVKVIKVEPGVNLKSIPVCDFYYDMKYDINYSTFCTIKNNMSSASSCLSSTLNKKEVQANGSKNNLNGIISNLKPCKSEVTLLDMYSGCGGMSTGLCMGAKLSGIDLVTKWAVDTNKYACESLKLNHPETQIRNESAEDFLDLIREWDKLCKKYPVGKEKMEGLGSRITRSGDKASNSKTDIKIPNEEYEVASLVDICYSDPARTGKRGLNFKVRWFGYGPSDDTWEPIEGLSKCQDKIREFVHKGMKANILPRPGDVDVICGGPPCQGISGFNRHRNFDSPLDDERNHQIVVFMEIINFLRPKYVLMENVVDILRFANGCLARYAISFLVRNNFQVRLGMMAAGCYGLPQFRLRVFLWGAHPCEHLPQFPLPTHDVVFKYGAPCEFERSVVAYEEGQFRDLEKAVLLGDAISDLPQVTSSEVRDKMRYEGAPQTEFQKYIRATQSDMMGLCPSNSTKVEKSLLYDHRPLQLNEDDYLRVCRIPKRKGANFRDLPGIVVGDDNVVRRTDEPVLMPSGKHWAPDYAINFGEGKSTKPFARLWWDETVSTVLCAPNPRCEAILHPEQDRVLTIREYARLQGFPDYYALCGSVNERYRQVGNAVAVPVGRALGYTLGMALQKLSGGDGDGDEPLTTLPPKFAHSTTIHLLQTSLLSPK